MTDQVEPPEQEIVAGASQLELARASKIGPSTVEGARNKGNQIVREAKRLLDIEDRHCRGRAKVRDGEGNVVIYSKTGKPFMKPCPNYAIKGGFVCVAHGGRAPQVKKKAAKRLLAMVEPALVRLNELMHQNEHLPTALGAIKTVIERAGDNAIGGLKESGSGDLRPVIQIGIQVGGIDPATPKVAVNLIPLPNTRIQKAMSDGAVDGEVAEDDGAAG